MIPSPDMLRHVTDEQIEQRVKVLRRELGLQNQSRPDMMTVMQRLTTSFRHFNISGYQTPRCPMQRRNGTLERASCECVRVSLVPCRGVSQEPEWPSPMKLRTSHAALGCSHQEHAPNDSWKIFVRRQERGK
jgi:hypothetical protein